MFSALCYFWCFFAWSCQASEELLTQRWHLRRALSNCLFAPSLPPSVPSLIIPVNNPLHRPHSYWSLPHAHKSELITVTTTLRTSLNEVALVKRMKLAERRSLTVPHRGSSRKESALGWLKWPSLHYFSHVELMCLSGEVFQQDGLNVLDHQ